MRNIVGIGFVPAFFIAAVCIILVLYAFENIALGASWRGELDLEKDPELFFKAIVETTVLELAISLFVIFSIMATLFAFSFERRLDTRIQEASQTVAQRAEKITRNSYQSVSANIFHEMAYKAFADVESRVMQSWHYGVVCLRQEDIGSAKELVGLGIHYSRRGLEHLEGYKAPQNESERLRRVPGHLNNSFLWHSAAMIILEGILSPPSFYSEHLRKIDELIAFVHDDSTPDLPSWYQAYESCAFFLVVYGASMNDQKMIDRGLKYLNMALSGSVPQYGMKPPSAVWVNEVRWQYKKAGYAL